MLWLLGMSKNYSFSHLTDGKKWKNTKFNNSILSKIVIHHCLPFVDEQRWVNCLLFPFLPRPFPRPLPLPTPNFVLALMGIVQSDLLAKGNRTGLLRRLTFLLLLICWRACVDLKVEGQFGKIENDEMCTETCQQKMHVFYLREYAACFYHSAKEPGLVIRQVILRFAQVLVCIHILFVYYVPRKMLHIQFECGSGSYQAT